MIASKNQQDANINKPNLLELTKKRTIINL